ncbi:MAG: homoserine dehydrogenase [Armatimonadota bacterium]
MSRKQINVGLIGLGIVGTGAARVLVENADLITAKVGIPVKLTKVADKDIVTKRPVELDPSVFTTDANELLNDPDIDIVIELIGGVHPAKEFVHTALANGKHVVTANKELIAKDGHELMDMADQNKLDFMFEGAVGGGIPIIGPMKTVLAANRIKRVMGIVNGTTNFILTKMAEDGADFDSVLKEAQAMGYAEANPTADVEGYDAKYKIAILASIGFVCRVNVDDVYCEGITKIAADEMRWAKELGYVIKLVAIASASDDGKMAIRVHPVMLHETHPLASVRGVSNAIMVNGDAVGDVMFFGPGAGSMPTGSVVAGDVVDIARNMVKNANGRVGCTCFEHRDVTPMDEVVSSHYLRMRVIDRPNVLAQVAGVLGANDISVRTVVQRQRLDEFAEIVWITHPATEGDFRRAVSELKRVPVVTSVCATMHVEFPAGSKY